MATRIQRTNTTPTLTTKCTFSAWVKRSDSAVGNSGRDAAIIETYTGANDYGFIRFDGNDQIQIYARNSSGNLIVCDTDAKYRDINAWYHIVATLDSTESTSSDRVKLYVNGVRQTFQGSPTYPGSSAEVWFNRNSSTFNIGNSEKYTSNFQFDGQYSHVHFIDGAAYQASTFGSTDSTTGEWKINTSPTITEYGANGFFMFKDDASLNDDSGKGNNFTVAAGSIQKTEDNPSNVFATMSPLHKGSNVALTNGNLTCTGSGSNASVASTLAVSTGKWYWEAKLNSSTNNYFNVGILKSDVRIDNLAFPGDVADGYVYAVDGNIYRSGSSLLSTGTTLSVGNIVGFLLDLDNGTLKLKVNGSDVYSGNAVVSSLNTGDFWYVAQGANPSSVDINFGNGYFGTTAISSEGTNASGIGKFEYDVPTGYTALSTKGLNE
ncbi:lectin-like protein [uncultured Mediterranean phage uvDeep-CGR2-KM24-C165]|nr:lectin-like protein [uncultured Mediterranean phage uvDeep-CGR2-KM24-C165]